MLRVSQSFHEVAKEITIAAIEKGLITHIRKSQYKDLEEIEKYSHDQAILIGNFYKTVAKAVNEAAQGNFKIKNEQE